MDLSSIIEQLAEKHNLSKQAVSLIVNSEFSFIRKVIASKEGKGVICTKLGKFAIKPNRTRLLNLKNRIGEQYRRDHPPKIITDPARLEELLIQQSQRRKSSSTES